MIAALLAVVAAGIGLIRLGWGGRRGAGVAGWAVVVAALLALTSGVGAWGAALGIVAGIGAAFVAVLGEAWRTPAHVARPPRAAAPVRQGFAVPDLARRLGVFVLAVPLGFAASAWLAVAAQHWGRTHGLGAADATVCCWLIQPVAWATLIAVQLTREGLRAMLTPTLVATAGGALLWAAA